MSVCRQCWFLSVLLVCGILIGCSGSEEARRATVLLQDTVATLRSQNDSLKKVVTKLELDNRTSVARIAGLEAQLADVQQKLAAIPPEPPPKPHMTDPHAAYNQGLEQFNAKHYAEAAATFQLALDSEAPENLQDNCYYWIGECAYGEKQYSKAIEYFQKVFTFEWSEKKDDSQLMIGNSYRALGNKAKAKEAYERLVKTFPASPYVKKAKERLGQI